MTRAAAMHVDVEHAAVVSTMSMALALSTAVGLFWTAYHDPVAIGWPLTPVIGAFWGALAGLLLGFVTRLVLERVWRHRAPRLVHLTAAVMGASILSSLLVAVFYIEGAAGTPGAVATVLVLAGVLPAIVVAVVHRRLRLRHVRRARSTI